MSAQPLTVDTAGQSKRWEKPPPKTWTSTRIQFLQRIFLVASYNLLFLIVSDFIKNLFFCIFCIFCAHFKGLLLFSAPVSLLSFDFWVKKM